MTDKDNDILLKTSPDVIDKNKNHQVTNNEPLIVIEDSPMKKQCSGKQVAPDIFNDKSKEVEKSLVFEDKNKEKNEPELSEIPHKSKDYISVTMNKANKEQDDCGTKNAAVTNDISKETHSDSENTVLNNSDLEGDLGFDKNTINQKESDNTIMGDNSSKHINDSENTIILDHNEQQNDLVTSTNDQKVDEPKKSDSIIILDENDSPKKQKNETETNLLIDNDAQNAIVTSTDEKIDKPKNIVTEINTIVLDDDDEDDAGTKTDVIDEDDCTVVEETPHDKNYNNKLIEYKEIFDESPILAELVVKCLNFKNTKGMLRVINRTLIALYKNVDKSYKKSDEFQKAVMNTIKNLESEPQLKFSHIKNLCDEFKMHRIRKRVPLLTLNMKYNKAQPSNIKPPKKQIEAVINLDDDDIDNDTAKKVEQNSRQKPNRIIINVEKDLSNFNYNDDSKKDTEPKSYEVPIVNDTDNIPIHQEFAPIEIDDDSGSDIVIGDGNYSDDDVILLDKSVNNKRKKKTPTKIKTKRKRKRPSQNHAVKGSLYGKELNHQVFNPINRCKQVAMTNNQSGQIALSNNQNNQIARCVEKSDHTIWRNYQKDNHVSYQTPLRNNQSDQVGWRNNQSNQLISRNSEINEGNQSILRELLQPTKATPVAVEMLEENNKKRIKLIEERIAYLKKKIDALDELEVADDSFNSPYILSEKFKVTIVCLYKELCKLTGNEAVKRHEVRLQVVPGHPEGPVRCLEKFLNDNIDEHGDPPFPDLQDVVQCVCKANQIFGMMWSRQQIWNEAHALFSQYGQTVQKRRQKREYKDLMSLVKEERVDPADLDADLQARLSANARVARKNESELLERFANLEKGVVNQPDLGLRINNSEDSDDSDENNEEISNMNEPPDKMNMNTATGETNTTINSGRSSINNNASVVDVDTAFKIGSWSIATTSNGFLSITPKISKIPNINTVTPIIVAHKPDAKMTTGNIATATKENPKISNVHSKKDDTECGFQIFTHTPKSNNTNANLNPDNVLKKNNIVIEKPDEQIILNSDTVIEENVMEVETATEIGNGSSDAKFQAEEEINKTEPIVDIGLKISNVVTMSAHSTVDVRNSIPDEIKIDTMDIDVDHNMRDNMNQLNVMDIVKAEVHISSTPETTIEDNEVINEETVRTYNLTTDKVTEVKNDEIKKDPENPKPELKILLEDICKVKDSAVTDIHKTCKETDSNNIAKNIDVATALMTQFSMQAVVKLTPLDISSIQKATECTKSRKNAIETEASCSQLGNVNANFLEPLPKIILEKINVQNDVVKDKERNTSLSISGVTDTDKKTEVPNVSNENLIEATIKNEEDKNPVEDKDLKVKREPLDIPTLLEGLGPNYTATIFDIEDPFMVIEISDSSDSEDENT